MTIMKIMKRKKNLDLSKLISSCFLFCLVAGLQTVSFSQERADVSGVTIPTSRTGLTPSSANNATELMLRAIQAMGGDAKLRGIASLTLEGIGHEYAVEQSERPEGPYLVSYQQVTETRDLGANRLRRSIEMRQLQTPQWFGVNLIVADGIAVYERNGRFIPRGVSEVKEAEITLALAPERLLFTALSAPDLRQDRNTVMEGVPQNVVKFTWKGIPVIVYLNSFTSLPTAVETTIAAPDNIFWSVWGDYSTRTFYSNWTLEPGGIHYPHQTDVTRNGYTLKSLTITSLKLNVPIASDQFRISDDAKKQFAGDQYNAEEMPLGNPKSPAVELAPGVINIPGNWGVTLVHQRDGVVIIEAPISSGYSAKVIAETRRRFPDVPIIGVVTTSDAFPHVGGLREYVADGIPIYALDLNLPLLERIVAAPRKAFPDKMERNPRRPIFRKVSSKTTVGSGPNRLEIYPVRTETGERMMMVYFPELRLLYSSDLVQKLPNGSFFSPQYLSEVMNAVDREKLTVDNVFAMHTERIRWSEVTDAVAKQSAPPEALRSQIIKLIDQILDADYRGDQATLQRVYQELEPFANDTELRSKVRYWRGFTQWRKAINGFNDAIEPKEIEKNLKLAIGEFEKALAADPSFVDAKVGAGSASGILLFLYGKNPELAPEYKDPARMHKALEKALAYVNDAEKADPENPRLLWVLGQVRWSMPVEMGGGQSKAIETNEKGLELARRTKSMASDTLTPSWGEPELMMNLAYDHLHKKEPDTAAAEQYARSALELVPNWHYVRDILLPQIEAAKRKGR